MTATVTILQQKFILSLGDQYDSHIHAVYIMVLHLTLDQLIQSSSAIPPQRLSSPR